MYTDPQSVTINATPYSLPRTGIGDGNATYKSSDGTVQMRISHREAKGRMRRMVRLDQTIIAADPLTAEQQYQTAGVYLVIDEPSVGFTDAQLQYIVTALNTWLTASTNANTTKLLGSET